MTFNNENRLQFRSSYWYNYDLIHADEELIEDITEKENSRTLWECVDSLPRNEPEIVRKRILNDMNYREIGESLGVTKQRTEQILKKAYKHLQEDERVLMIARTEGIIISC